MNKYDTLFRELNCKRLYLSTSVTWEKSLVTDDEGLVGAKFISEKEVWLLGSAQSKRQVNGQFYRSTDGGHSFTLAQVNSILLPPYHNGSITYAQSKLTS